VFPKKLRSQPSIPPILHYSNFFPLQIKIAGVLIIVFFSVTTVVSAAPLNGPWGQESLQQNHRTRGEAAPSLFRFLVEAYQENISPIDGKDCPMYPSCSEYSIQSFNKHGSLVGWIMTVDRLFRCGRDELRLSPQIIVDGERRWYDPPERNDFWWHDDR
jgi:putative component of membrane protein insertase Oxa1/YidC/SpoIIIJ protein YidD